MSNWKDDTRIFKLVTNGKSAGNDSFLWVVISNRYPIYILDEFRLDNGSSSWQCYFIKKSYHRFLRVSKTCD
jgi:hypothetical protein